MALGLNLTSPPIYTSGFLIGDLVQAPGGSIDALPKPTLALNPGATLTLPVSAAMEIKSTLGGLLIPRMTTAQRLALDNTTTTITNGLMVYDTDLNDFAFYQGANWVALTALSGITGPISSTNTALVRWNGTGGTVVEDSTVLLSGAGAITGPISIALGTTSTTNGTLTFLNSTNGNTLAFRPGITGGNLIFTLPIADGLEPNAPLVTDTTGVLSFGTTVGLGTGGSTTGHIVLYNSGNTHTFTIQPGTTATTNLLFTLPVKDGQETGAPLVTDAGGILSFGTTIGLGAPSGATTPTTGNITLYNSASAFTLTLRAGNTGSNLIFTLPTTDGPQANAPLVTDAAGTLSFGTTITLGKATTTTGSVVLYNSTNAFTLTLHPGITASSFSLTLPIADGKVAGSPLVSDAAGTLTFGTTLGLGTPSNLASPATGQVVLYNLTNTNTLTLKPGTTAASYSLTLPTADATYANAPLVSNAAGTLSFNNNAILSATVTLTQAQVQGAFAAPVQIVAAPGAGETIVVAHAQVYTNFQTAAFTGGGIAILQYDNTIHGAGTNALAATIPTAEITAAASQIYGLNGVTASALTAITNKGIFFSNATGAFTAGNAASTVVITVHYMVLAATV